MRLLGECDDHPVGTLRGASDPVMSHSSAAFSPFLGANVLSTVESVWADPEVGGGAIIEARGATPCVRLDSDGDSAMGMSSDES